LPFTRSIKARRAASNESGRAAKRRAQSQEYSDVDNISVIDRNMRVKNVFMPVKVVEVSVKVGDMRMNVSNMRGKVVIVRVKVVDVSIQVGDVSVNVRE
jgi:hypothetical protein